MLAKSQVIKPKTDQQLDSGVNMDGTSYRKDQAGEIFAKGIAKINQAFRSVRIEERHQLPRNQKTWKSFFYRGQKIFTLQQTKKTKAR